MAYDVMRRMREEAAARGLRLTAHTATPRWYGERPDYDACIRGLDSAERRAGAGMLAARKSWMEARDER